MSITGIAEGTDPENVFANYTSIKNTVSLLIHRPNGKNSNR